MTQWGALLLCGYIVLGATSRIGRRKAGHLALVLTGAVLTVAMVHYMHSTPTDKYYRTVDATVYATGNPASAMPDSTEDITGVQAATPEATVTATVGPGGGG